MNDLKNQFTQDGTQQLWGLVTGSIAGLLDGLLIVVAYILYPFVVAIFGFFYIFYGSVLYIFGPIVIALMPLSAANRIAKAYVENVLIWNAWPILYGGFGALLSAVQMGQVGQMLNQNDFLGGLGNLEGSFLIGIASIIFSLAIAVIPFIAKRIVSGDVGSTAAALIGTAATALTVGAAAVEGAAAGVAAGGSGAATGSSPGSSAGSAAAGAGRTTTISTGSNQPAAPQQSPRVSSEASQVTEGTSDVNSSRAVSGVGSSFEPTAEGHAEQMRNFMSEAMGGDGAEEQSASEASATTDSSHPMATSSPRPNANSGPRSSAPPRRGPSVHRYNIGTWGAFHAARIAARSVAGVATRTSATDQE